MGMPLLGGLLVQTGWQHGLLEKQSEYVLQVTAHEDLVRRQWNVLNHQTLHRASHDALLVSE